METSGMEKDSNSTILHGLENSANYVSFGKWHLRNGDRKPQLDGHFGG